MAISQRESISKENPIKPIAAVICALLAGSLSAVNLANAAEGHAKAHAEHA